MTRTQSAFSAVLAVLFLRVAVAPVPGWAQAGPRNTKSPVCDAVHYGAKANGKTDDTAALQKAIDACAKMGGGTVLLQSGVFLTGPLQLKSHIALEIGSGAKLLGSPNHGDFKPVELFRERAVQPLILAEHAEDIRITGGGTIDGNGAAWWNIVDGRKSRHQLPVAERPRLVVFDHCSHVTVDHLHIENGASWQVVPYDSDDVNIHDVQITAPANSPNTDGIDPFSSHNVRISHVRIDTGDDNVAIKSGQPKSTGQDRASTDILVTDSVFLHGHGMSIGSEISGGVTNVRVERVQFRHTAHGVRVKSARDRGGDIGDFIFRDLTMEEVPEPILISAYYSGKPANDSAQPVTRLTPRFHDIHIENLTARGARAAGVIEGLPESPARNIFLDRVRIDAERGLVVANATVTARGLVIQTRSGPPVILRDHGILRRR